MYHSQQELNLLHKERVENLSKGAKPRRSSNQANLAQRLWKSIRNMLPQQGVASQAQAAPRPSHLSTQEWAVVGKK